MRFVRHRAQKVEITKYIIYEKEQGQKKVYTHNKHFTSIFFV